MDTIHTLYSFLDNLPWPVLMAIGIVHGVTVVIALIYFSQSDVRYRADYHAWIGVVVLVFGLFATLYYAINILLMPFAMAYGVWSEWSWWNNLDLEKRQTCTKQKIWWTLLEGAGSTFFFGCFQVGGMLAAWWEHRKASTATADA